MGICRSKRKRPYGIGYRRSSVGCADEEAPLISNGGTLSGYPKSPGNLTIEERDLPNNSNDFPITSNGSSVFDFNRSIIEETNPQITTTTEENILIEIPETSNRMILEKVNPQNKEVLSLSMDNVSTGNIISSEIVFVERNACVPQTEMEGTVSNETSSNENTDARETTVMGICESVSIMEEDTCKLNLSIENKEIPKITESSNHTVKETDASTYEENTSLETSVTVEEMTMISRMMFRNQYLPLARKLKITKQKVEEFDVDCTTRRLGDEEIVIQILEEWKRNNGNSATKDQLKEALVFIGRRDIATKVFSNLPDYIDREKMKIKYLGIRKQLEDSQENVYRDVELPQVIWTDRILPLEELYVNLELVKNADDKKGNNGVPMQLKELFNQINGKDPLRILIEGGPGYGKTTLCYKLLNDWGRNRNYIRSKFKMVFLFELRYFQESDSIEEMLKSECETVGVNGDDGISCIEAFENETLLILDGFDELNDEGKAKFLPLIQKKKCPFMFVVVTSRRGMIGKDEGKRINIGGGLKKTLQNVNTKNLCNKRVLIKGVTRDKIETFMIKYFNKEFKNWGSKMQKIMKEEMIEVFQCPLFLILLAMLLEEKSLETINSKTILYMEFFNFISRRNLIRENKISHEEEIDIFDESCNYSKLIQLINQLGRLAIEHLCENKLLFQEKEVLEYCEDKIIFHLGFLTKIPKMQGRREQNFYQPIHKSFLEFVAAFSMWNLFKTDEDQFKREIERIGDKGLKPTNDSLFYVFLGGLMNSKASVLFQSLTRYRLWFNIESLCFTNILLEIKDIRSFFASFQPVLDLFISSLYSIDDCRGLTEEYFQSEIHFLILKYSCDRNLINLLWWNSAFSFKLSKGLKFEHLYLCLNEKISKFSSNENRNSINCQNIICKFTECFKKDKWGKLVSFFNSIPCEKINFFFGSEMNEINYLALQLVHNELTEGEWKEMTIDRIRFVLTEFDHPGSLSLLRDLVEKNRIVEGISLEINESMTRTPKQVNFLRRETKKLFNAIIHSNTIQEFIVYNADHQFSPELNFNEITNSYLNSFHFKGSLNIIYSHETKENKIPVEKMTSDLNDFQKELDFIQTIQGLKYLGCKFSCFRLLAKMDWPGLKEIEELELYLGNDTDKFQILNTALQLTNLRILTLDVQSIKNIPLDCKDTFINFFSSPSLKICQFAFIQDHESFSFLTEVVMKGLRKKEEHGAKRFQLQELVLMFDQREMDFYKLKECKEIQWIQSMLKTRQLQRCCWVDYLNNIIKSDQFQFLFPLNDKFTISREVDGRYANSSRWCQSEYCWMILRERYSIMFLDE